MTEGKIVTERIPPHRVLPPPPTSSTRAYITRPQQAAQTTLSPRSALPSFQRTESAQHTPSSGTDEKLTPSRSILQAWRQIQSVVTVTPPLLLTKRLFLIAALLDLLLLLGGMWFGPSPFMLIGTIVAIGICICGLTLNFLTEPWIWVITFLLLSPLPGALYVFAVNVIRAERTIMNWQAFCAYLFLTPIAGMLYGLFGPISPREEIMNPTFTKKLMTPIWFLGAALVIVGLFVHVFIYIGLSWILASGILATAQAIRLQQWKWLEELALVSAMTLGVPLLAWGLIYGIFGPTSKEEHEAF